MIYRRVIDVTDALSPDEKNFANLISPTTNEDNQSFDDHDITDCVPTDLFDQKRIDDSPDIFKRARLFTRWQDAEESRDRQPMLTFGGISVWRACGLAEDAKNLLIDRMSECVQADANRMNECIPAGVSAVVLGVFFIGTSRQRAIPTILVYAKQKWLRQRVVEELRKLDWLEPRKSSLMMTTWYNPVIRRDVIEYFAYEGEDRNLLEQLF
jgi:hypothetical protein